jgi:mycothiol synthase
MLDAASRCLTGRATTEAQVVDRLNTPGTDPSRDAVCAWSDGGILLGFGHLWPAHPDETRCFARTHPDHHGQGVGTALQRWLVSRAEEVTAATSAGGPGVLTTTSWPRDRQGEDLLARIGYQPVRYYLKMVMDFDERRPRQLPAPADVTVRTFADGDEDALFAAYVESFSGHWGQGHPTPEQWWRERRESSSAGFDRNLWLVVLQDDQLIGFAIARTDLDGGGKPYGYIGDLGVRPRWRGRGLAEVLLTRSLTALQERGLAYATLDVDTENTTGAVRLYTKAGMQQRPSFTIWSRTLRRPSSTPPRSPR